MDRNDTEMDRNETGMDRNEIHFTKHTHVSDWFSKNISPCACLLWVGRDEVAFAMIFLVILSTRCIGKQPLQ